MTKVKHPGLRALGIGSLATVAFAALTCAGAINAPSAGHTDALTTTLRPQWCVRGALAPGQRVGGRLDSRSCLAWSSPYAYFQEPTLVESWTIKAEARTAYIISLDHVADRHNADSWRGNVALFGRTSPASDWTFVAGWWGAFGDDTSFGAANKELILAAPDRREYLVRVESLTPEDSGSYVIDVRACTVVPIENNRPTPPGDETDCYSAADAARGGGRLAFFSFNASAGDHGLVALLPNGPGAPSQDHWLTVSGPAPDALCHRRGCSWNGGAATSSTLRLPFETVAGGQYTVIVSTPPAAVGSPYAVTLVKKSRAAARP